MDNPTLHIIIPARNEEENIIGTLEQIRGEVKIPYKIIVVDDSRDNTQKLVKAYAKKHKNVSIVHGKPNTISFGKALEIGFARVKNGIGIVVMADLCDKPATINKMYEKVKSGWDVVCGSRYMKGGKKIGGPFLQNLLSFLVCKSLHLLTGVPTTDVSNAFKMYKKEALKGVRFNDKSGVEGSMEVLLQVYFNGYKITEVPTSWVGRISGQSKFSIFKRAPRYWRIYRWAIENSFRKTLGLNLKKFYV